MGDFFLWMTNDLCGVDSKQNKMKGTIKIKIKGHLDSSWKEWFDGLDIITQGDYTILRGEARDEAFIYGILNKIRDLNLKLISVEKTESPNNE